MFLKDYIPDEDCLRLISEYVGTEDAKNVFKNKVLKQMERTRRFMTMKHEWQRYYTVAHLLTHNIKTKRFYLEVIETYKCRDDMPMRITGDGFKMLNDEYDETWDTLTIMHEDGLIKTVYHFNLQDKEHIPRGTIKILNEKYDKYFTISYETFKYCTKCRFSLEFRGFGFDDKLHNSTKKLYKYCIFCRKPPTMDKRPLPLHFLLG